MVLLCPGKQLLCEQFLEDFQQCTRTPLQTLRLKSAAWSSAGRDMTVQNGNVSVGLS